MLCSVPPLQIRRITKRLQDEIINICFDSYLHNWESLFKKFNFDKYKFKIFFHVSMLYQEQKQFEFNELSKKFHHSKSLSIEKRPTSKYVEQVLTSNRVS